ncbi:MAG: Dabb family protein [Spirochaetia bacterium]|nr:Dabb family protein [Spirochaetia bacterium]
MIKHIVIWKLKEHAEGRTKTENAALAKTKLEALNGKIKGMRLLETGRDLGLDAGAWDLALYSEFDDKASLDAYQVHPEHEAFKTWFAPLRESRVVVDYSIP